MISRLYCAASDLEAMLQLLLSIRSPETILDYPSVVDLRDLLSLPEMQAATQIWETEEGQLAGFALVDTVNNLLFELDPRKTTPEIENQVVAWGIGHTSQVFKGGKRRLSLDATCRMEDTARKGLLERHGFVRILGESVIMTRLLSGPVPTPVLPSGFTIRPVGGEKEVGAYVALHQEAFGTRNMTIEHRLDIMGAPDYIPELDLVAVASDGALAALCVCRISSLENKRSGRLRGWTDPVATHPAYRRRGLSKALLLTGLKLMQDRGMEEARLSTSGDNIPMIRAASAAGFFISSTRCWYSKTIVVDHA